MWLRTTNKNSEHTAQERSSPVYSRGRLLAEDQLIGEVCHLSCFRSVQVFSSPFLSVFDKTKPSAAVSWFPLDREVGWFRLSLVDFGCLGSSAVVWLARSVLTLTEEHISLFGWFHSALIEVQQGAPPLQLFT